MIERQAPVAEERVAAIVLESRAVICGEIDRITNALHETFNIEVPAKDVLGIEIQRSLQSGAVRDRHGPARGQIQWRITGVRCVHQTESHIDLAKQGSILRPF